MSDTTFFDRPGRAQRLLGTPRPASRIFDIEARNAPRQRHVFAVRFFSQFFAPGPGPVRDLTFVVKSVDRPGVQPTTEELNQYNKKRLVHTGYKLQPVKVVFYDTWQGVAMRMWDSYMRHYFGDFWKQDINAYRYDVTTPGGMLDDSRGTGFGFTGRNQQGLAPSSGDKNAQFFFEKIQIMHFYGRDLYDVWNLVNPRISSFDPDELNYEEAGPSLITAQFSYEAMFFEQAQNGDGLNLFKTDEGFDNKVPTPEGESTRQARWDFRTPRGREPTLATPSRGVLDEAASNPLAVLQTTRGTLQDSAQRTLLALQAQRQTLAEAERRSLRDLQAQRQALAEAELGRLAELSQQRPQTTDPVVEALLRIDPQRRTLADPEVRALLALIPDRSILPLDIRETLGIPLRDALSDGGTSAISELTPQRDDGVPDAVLPSSTPDRQALQDAASASLLSLNPDRQELRDAAAALLLSLDPDRQALQDAASASLLSLNPDRQTLPNVAGAGSDAARRSVDAYLDSLRRGQNPTPPQPTDYLTAPSDTTRPYTPPPANVGFGVGFLPSAYNVTDPYYSRPYAAGGAPSIFGMYLPSLIPPRTLPRATSWTGFNPYYQTPFSLFRR